MTGKYRRGLTIALAIVVLCAGSVLWWAVRRPAETRRPSILLISLCSVRPDHMSCYGYQRRTTPTFDDLAREAIVFDHAVTPWPKTTPAFAAIMTGKYGHTTAVMRVTSGQRLGEEHQTLAEVLRTHGYATGAFVSSPALNRQTNLCQGFQVYEEVWRRPRPRSFFEATAHALAWLREQKGKPFFLWVHYNNAHYPYRQSGASPELFVDDEFYDSSRRVVENSPQPLALDVPDEQPWRAQILRPDIGGVHPSARLARRPGEYDYYIARYDAGIYAADRMARQLLKGIRKLGMLEGTIVVVVGDHGESLGEHNYYFEHGRFPYDDCLKVPLLIRPAGAVMPKRVHQPVAAFGLAPTLLEMTRIEAPADMEARSLLPVAEGREEPGYVFAESGYQLDFALSVRDAQWKLTHIPNEVDRSLMTGSEYELYNLVRDPAELDNRYQAEPKVAARLGNALEEWSRPWIDKAYRRPARTDVPLDTEAVEKLRSLGYVP